MLLSFLSVSLFPPMIFIQDVAERLRHDQRAIVDNVDLMEKSGLLSLQLSNLSFHPPEVIC